MAKQIGNQELMETWASEGDVSEPFLSKKRQGWLFQEQPASSIANWLVNIQGQKLNHLLKNGVSEWSINTDYTRGAIVKHANTAWRALRDNTASEPAPDNLDWAEVSTLPILRAPDLISPVDGASGTSTTVTLTASGYAPVYSVDSRDYREFEVDVSGGDFSAPIRTNQVDADTWAVDPALDASAGYEWRCRDVSTRGDVSEWSVIEPFTTGADFVTTPSITAPADNATGITETPTFESSAFAVTGTTDTHVASYWRVYQGTTLVWETGRTTSDLESATIPSGILVDGQTVYTVQVRHEGDTLGLSAWSTASTFTTLDTFTRVAQPSITSPLEAETDITETPTFESSAFSVVNGSDTHAASRWEVYDNADSLVWDSGRDTINRTSITMPSGILQDGETTYKVRVQHEGQSLGTSAWSETVSFVTQDSFGILFRGTQTGKVEKINPLDMTSMDSLSVSGSVDALAFGSNGFLYSGSEDDDEPLRKIDPETMNSVATLGSTQTWSLAFGTDGFLYEGTNTDLIRKINASTLAVVDSLGNDDCYSLAFGNDGFLYAGMQSGAVRKIDVSSMTEAAAFNGHVATGQTQINGLAYGTDGFVYSFSVDGTVRKVDPSDMSQAGIRTLPSDFGSATSLCFGSDGFLYAGYLVTTGRGGPWIVEKINPANMALSLDKPSGGGYVAFGSDGFLYIGTSNVPLAEKVDPSDMTVVDSMSAGVGGDTRSIAFNISIPELLGFTA